MTGAVRSKDFATSRRRGARGVPAVAVAALVVLGMVGRAAMARADGEQWLHLFHVGHNESANVVQYDLVVDARCRPAGASPIKVYWRQTKKRTTRSLSVLERRAYAVKGVVREQHGVRFHVAARPEQTAHARVEMRDGKCHAEAWTSVDGRKAVLTKAWIKTADRSWWRLPKVLFVDLFARGMSGESVFERIFP